MTSTLSFLSSQNSLFSTIITFYTLILLYFPSLFLQIISSPIPISTIILTLSLLRLGQSQYSIQIDQQHEKRYQYQYQEPYFSLGQSRYSNQVEQQHENEDEYDQEQENDSIHQEPDPEPEPEPTRSYDNSFVEWDVRAPLEIIYEEHEEGEEADQNDVEYEKNVIQRYGSLSLYYPETDSDGSSDGDFPATGWDSPEKMSFRWDGDYDCDKDGLIEIELDDDHGSGKRRRNEVEEDNLIEIDIFPA